jgi:hypothetical protein
MYDDEGYWLISLRSYHLHGSLYHDTFAQVGPLFYEFWSMVYSLTRLPIDLNTGRALTLVVWIATSVLFAIAVYRLTRQLALGLVAEILSFLILLSLINEPMEPAGLAYFFTACALVGLTVVCRGSARLGMVIVGVFTMAALLTKINIGLFLAVGVAYALLVCWPSTRSGRTRRAIGGVLLLAIPIVLMAQIIDRQWVQWYLLIELFALIGLIAVVTTAGRPISSVSARNVLWGLLAAAATAALAAIGVMINGTTLSELVGGGLLSQRGLAKVATIPLPVTSADVLIAGICAAIAIVVAFSGYVPGALIRIALGVWLSIAIVGSLTNPHLSVPTFPTQSYVLAAPLAWVALVRRSRADASISFGRTAICTAGVLSFLEAFPGAGSQRSWACLLLVPVALLCISDGMYMLMIRLESTTMTGGRRHTYSMVSWSAVAALALIPVVVPAARLLSSERTQYYSEPSLGLPGAETLRLPSSQVADLRAVTAALKAHCSTFESVPGVNSFYFFTGQSPPTDFNTTQWWKLLGIDEQRATVTSLERAPRPCVLVNLALIFFWNAIGPEPSLTSKTPLLRFTRDDLVRLRTLKNPGWWLYVKPKD